MHPEHLKNKKNLKQLKRKVGSYYSVNKNDSKKERRVRTIGSEGNGGRRLAREEGLGAKKGMTWKEGKGGCAVRRGRRGR